jgi:hypothetical protein
MPNLDGSGGILDFVFAAVFPGIIKTVAHLAIGIVRQYYAARFANVFQARSDIDAVT